MSSAQNDVVVIGGGAAGLMCAIEAGKRGRKVVVLEHAERLGKKILISGGGRCNFTNLQVRAENYLSAQPDFCKSALARYPSGDFIELVEKHGIAYHEKKLGQLFCDRSSKEIVEMLEEECRRANVEVKVGCRVTSVRKNDRFQMESNQGSWTSQSLVIATGGLSFPKLGASDFGYRVARDFGLKLVESRPGLVPLEFSSEPAFSELSGISIDVGVSCGRQTFRENILFTHRGLSGPAILQISSYWKPGEEIEIDLLPEMPAEHFFAGAGNKTLTALLSLHLPRRFVQYATAFLGPDKPVAQYPKAELLALAQRLHRWKLAPSGTEGYAKAEVTLGGIHPEELSSKTMESRSVPGLYFVGEVVDVTGWLGGFNFQWAWASGHAAGQFA